MFCTIIYQDIHNYNSLAIKCCETQDEAENFVIDLNEENCPPGNIMEYVIINGNFALMPGSIDRT